MRTFLTPSLLLMLGGFFVLSCASNPYASTNRSHKKQIRAYARDLMEIPPEGPGEDSLRMGDFWAGTTNFSMRRPNYVIIHHTAQNSTEQTLETFTLPRTQVSAHYVIGKDGKVYHMLNNYMRAWHAGAGKWGNNNDLNSSSIGIELDNNGFEPFPEAQINSLLEVLAGLKEAYGIPTANFIGHSDIAPTRKVDPNPHFPWKKLAGEGFGLWYDEDMLTRKAILSGTAVPDSAVMFDKTVDLDSVVIFQRTVILKKPAVIDSVTVPDHFNPEEALRIIGYDTSDLDAAIRAFKLHFIQKDINTGLSEDDIRILYNLYQKYL